MADWHHSPQHRLTEAGEYLVTAGTHQRAPYFASPERLCLVRDSLFDLADEHDLQLQAWAVMSNHYHFVSLVQSDPSNLRRMIALLHAVTAGQINERDRTPGRQVWFQYWDSHLTFQRYYYARLNYVHQNPVHHRIVAVASAYEWCSAAWFERSAEPSFFRTISSFKTDLVKVADDFGKL